LHVGEGLRKGKQVDSDTSIVEAIEDRLWVRQHLILFPLQSSNSYQPAFDPDIHSGDAYE
jgi:hypothetical protein